MLAEMRIQGLGVIDDATLEPHPGLTVLTGETGAGKTMVVTGLTLLGGGRAEASRVSEGAGRALVEGRFVAGEAALRIAEEVGAEADEDGTLIAIRTVSADGRSRAHLGGRSVPVGVLSRLAEAVLAVHGQNDQLRLLRSTEQRAVLDRYAGDAVSGPLEEYRAVRERWKHVCEQLVERRDSARELAREADLLRHGVNEISSVNPQPGEDVALVAEARRLAEADDLRAAAGGARMAVAGGDGGGELDVASDGSDQPGALGLLGEARRLLVDSGDPALVQLAPRLAEADVVLADVAGELAGYLEALDADPERLQTVLARQAELRSLTRKYAADTDGVLHWAEQAAERLAGIDTSDEAIAALVAERDQLAGHLVKHAEALSKARQEAAGRLASAVTDELSGLAMPDARLSVELSRRELDGAAARGADSGGVQLDGRWVQAGPDGVDEVELRLVPHAGSAAVPLHKGASGGELSRVMLALEVVLAHADPVPTMVFDEVDAGVGGRAAVEIGRRLARLASSHQVIVVTHLPQVAAYADRHVVVDKRGAQTKGTTQGRVRTLSEADRIVELARMLAGLDDTGTGRAHAEELLTMASTEKAEQRSSTAGTGRRARARKNNTE
ncbi:DNA repair protein RecN [Pseudonocardia spinosispora]|uniref:DNA repair protein RecN n=1 Tax=Pseudonocardia spinosispora TaxID=103441 RepID=UPI00040B3C0A|nr:DNA repair protein RecN [Pseudonocardia spinosispora]